MKKFYILYKTINKLNGMYYIGAHSTNNLNDGYFGSGKLIKEAIKEFGKENFERITLELFDNADDMFLAENKYITPEIVKDPLSYNQNYGGAGITDDENYTRWGNKEYHDKVANSIKKFANSPEGKKQLSKSAFTRWSDPKFKEKMTLISNSTEVREKHSQAAKKHWEENYNSIVEKRNTPEYKEMKSKEMKKRYEDEEFRKKMDESRKDRVWMYSEILRKNTTVKKDKVKEMESNGWILGRKQEYFKQTS